MSLAPSITQNLYLIEAQGQIVGCTRFCLTEAKDSIPVVAGCREREHGENCRTKTGHRDHLRVNSPESVRRTRRMGIKTLRIGQPKNFNEICEQLITLSEISGKKELAETIVRESKTRLATIQKNNSLRETPEDIHGDRSQPFVHGTSRYIYARLYPTNRRPQHRPSLIMLLSRKNTCCFKTRK